MHSDVKILQNEVLLPQSKNKFSGAFHVMDARQCLSFSNISSSEQQEIASIFLILPELDKLDFYYSHYATSKPKD